MIHRLRILIIAFAAFDSVVSVPAHADEDDEEEEEESSLNIPGRLQGGGYKLRLPGRDVALESSTIDLPEDRRTEAELLDRHNRIADRGEVFPGSRLLLYPRQWSLGLSSGAVVPTPRSVWQKAMLPRVAHETSLDATYRLNSTWDAWGNWTRRYAHRDLDEALDLQYDASLVLLGASRQIAPWGHRTTSALRRVHVAILGAAGYNQTHYNLGDEYTSVEEETGTATAVFGIEIRMPVFDNFWLNIRDLGRIEALSIDELDVDGVMLLNSTSAGVNYAF